MGDTQRIGPYVLLGELGRGAMARVWRAWDPHLEREVAVKEPVFQAGLPPAVAEEMGWRFVAEGRAAARLSHPGVVAVYAADVWDGRPAIVMELVEGQTLARALERGPLPAGQALSVLDQLLDALGYAHARGVVHRDVKPDNVFLATDGRAKLGDFGVAHVEGGGSRATVAGSVIGTPGYMSPEQARGLAVDARSDLFSVAVVAYEMLAGRNPFGAGDGCDSTTLIYRIVHEPAAPLPADALAGVAPCVSAAISRALSKDPADRPSSAEEFRAELRGGAPPTAVPRRNPPSSSQRWLPIVLVAVVGIIVTAVIAFNALGTRSTSGSASPNSTVPAPAKQTQTEPATLDTTVASDATASTAQDISTDEDASSQITYYIASHDSFVALFASNAATPVKITDVSVADLGQESATMVDAHVSTATLEDAEAIVERLRSEATQRHAENSAAQEAARIEAEAKAHPPVFDTASASSTLPGDQITSYYGPDNTRDDDFTTAWNEGADGAGIGEWIMLEAARPQWVRGIEIVTGYPKREEVFFWNNRAKTVTVELSDGFTTQLSLDDAFRKYQTFDFGDYHQTTYVKVTIDSVYEGNRWDDTAICEIRII